MSPKEFCQPNVCPPNFWLITYTYRGIVYKVDVIGLPAVRSPRVDAYWGRIIRIYLDNKHHQNSLHMVCLRKSVLSALQHLDIEIDVKIIHVVSFSSNAATTLLKCRNEPYPIETYSKLYYHSWGRV